MARAANTGSISFQQNTGFSTLQICPELGCSRGIHNKRSTIPYHTIPYQQNETSTMTKSILKDSSNATASSYSSARKEVAWGELTTWEFPNILGDNPSVTEGVPLSIGWKPLRQEKVGIDYYEYLRRSNTRRTRKELVQDSGVRGSL